MENSLDEFAVMLIEGCEEARRTQERLPKPIASVYVSKAGSAMDICLDTSKATYSEWIKGEGGDIDLKRDRETKKLAGAHLPCYAKTLVIGGEAFPTITIDLESGAVKIDEPDSTAVVTN